MSEIDLVAIDLDGTLLQYDLNISDRDQRMIQQAIQKGVRIVLATGRMYRTTIPYGRQLGLTTPLVCFNGAYVCDIDRKRILEHHHFDSKYALEIFRESLRWDLHINYYVEDDINVKEMNDLVGAYARRIDCEVNVVPDIEGFLNEHPRLTKLTIQSWEQEELDAFGDWIAKRWPHELYLVKANSLFLEVANPHASKGTGVKRVAEEYGISPDRVMVIGDNYNDLSMFEYAGVSVAMGNAEEAIKEAADHVTDRNDCHGVAKALEKFVLKD